MTLGVRPHDVSICPEGESGITATVSRVERTGAETILACRLTSGRDIVVITPGIAAARTGDRIELAFETKLLHRFDRATGQTLVA